MLAKNFSQRGQALILLVAAIVGLVAITALAIDAGNAFSDRRHAQNAADTAALAGALTCAMTATQDCTLVSNQVRTIALERAGGSNGYTNDGVNTVTVNNPPVAGCNGTNGPYVGNTEYVQVIIRSTVDTFFAPIVGINQLNNCVEAIARAKPSDPPGKGSAIISLSCDAKWAIQAGGATEIVVHGGGVYSNSNHAEAIYVQKLTNLQLDQGYKAVAVGGVNVPVGYPHEQFVLPPLFPCPLPPTHPLLLQPPYPCDFDVPGDFKPPDGTVLTPGVYCIEGSFVEAQITGTGVTFIMLKKGISWQGNKQMQLSAPTGDVPTKGLLIYIPPSNNTAVTLNGTANTKFTGTILAPSSLITVSGDLQGVGEIKSSFIGLEVKLTGKGEFDVNYDAGDVWKYAPQIELSK